MRAPLRGEGTKLLASRPQYFFLTSKGGRGGILSDHMAVLSVFVSTRQGHHDQTGITTNHNE